MNVDYPQAPQTSRDETNYERLIPRSNKKHLSISVNKAGLLQNFESFQDFVTGEGKFLGQISEEEFLNLERIYQILNKEAIIENNYKSDILKATKDLENIKSSQLPVPIKLRMSAALVESIKTSLRCLQEKKKTTKEMIIALEKANNYSTYLNLIRRWKESNKISRNHSISSTSTKVSTKRSSIAISPNDFSSSMLADSVPNSAESFLSNQNTMDDSAKEESSNVYENAKQDNAQLEDVIAGLKQTRNVLSVAVDNCRDDLSDYQVFVQAHKNRLRGKIEQIEEMKLKISSESSKNSTNPKLWHTYKQPSNNESLCIDRSMSSGANTTVLQEVQSKVSNLFGKVFNRKNKDSISGQVLPTDFLDDLDLSKQSTQREEFQTSIVASKTNIGSSASISSVVPPKFSIKMPKLSGRLFMQRSTKN